MTKRILRAAGTLAAALVFLAGCDAAGAASEAELGGLSPTANLDIPTIPGPDGISQSCVGNYSLVFRDGTTGTFSIAYGPGAIVSQSSTASSSNAAVTRTGFGNIRLVFTPTGASLASNAKTIIGESNDC